MNNLNSLDIKKLHLKAVRGKKHPDKFLDLVWTHSLIVKKICLNIVDNLDKKTRSGINRELLEKGALIHDIGVYFCFDEDFNPDQEAPKYFYHGWQGEKFLKSCGIDDKKLLRFTTVHPGVGITKKDIERERLDLPKKDFTPTSIEEEILTYADKFHTKSPSFVSFNEAKGKLEKINKNKGIKMDLYRKKFGLPNLHELKKEYKNWHESFKNFWKEIEG